jgi:hypothetical protein
MSAVELIREEPPPCLGRGGYSPLNEWLHPGEWAKYAEPQYSNIASKIRNGQGYGAKPGEFEVRTVNVSGPGRAWIYARYVGTPDIRSVATA